MANRVAEQGLRAVTSRQGCVRPSPFPRVQVNAILSGMCAEDPTLWLVRLTGTRVALIKRIEGGSPQVAMCATCSAALHCVSRFEAQYTPAVGAHHWCAAVSAYQSS